METTFVFSKSLYILLIISFIERFTWNIVCDDLYRCYSWKLCTPACRSCIILSDSCFSPRVSKPLRVPEHDKQLAISRTSGKQSSAGSAQAKVRTVWTSFRLGAVILKHVLRLLFLLFLAVGTHEFFLFSLLYCWFFSMIVIWCRLNLLASCLQNSTRSGERYIAPSLRLVHCSILVFLVCFVIC